jgi:lysophospholipase L1-like esterase
MYPAVPGNVLVDRNVSLRVGGRDLHPITPAAGGALTALCEEQPGGITYESDRYGFNNTDGIWDRASLDVALVGDSFTQGVCVQRPDQLAMLLNAQGFSTINLGARGAGPLQSLAILREYAAERQPGAVVWTYYEGNDLFDLGKEVNRPWLTDYLDESHRQGLAAVAEGIGPAYAAWIDSLLIVGPDSIGAGPRTLPRVTLRLRDIAKMVSLRELSGFGSIFPTRVSSIGVVPEVLAQAHREVKAWNGRLYLVYLPAFERYRTLIGEGIEGRREILRAAESAGIPVIDLDMVFRETGDPRDLWAHPRGHLTEEGYRIMAGAIANRLRSDLAH